MARTIESPGVQINEIDLSLNAQLPVGTNILINGFSDSGPTQELLNITSLDEYKQIYGIPTNAAERYSYHTMAQVLGTSAKVLYNRLPYGTDGGSGFNNSYTALLYPVHSIVATSGGVVSGSTSSLDYQVSGATGEQVYHIVGKPSQIILTESQYADWQAGNLNWSTTGVALTGSAPTSVATAGNAGIIVVNKLQTSVNQDFEGYYIALTDNYKSSTSTSETDSIFDSIVSIQTSKNAVSGVTSSSTWATLNSTRLDFKLSGDASSNQGSISEALEGIPSWDFGNSAYQDALIVGIYKLRRSGFSPTENALTFVPYESFIGSLGADRKYTAPNSFQETSFSLEKIVDDGSSYLDILVNPNLSKGNWLGEDGTPSKKVRIASSQLLSELSATCGRSDSAFTIGLYQEKTAVDKTIGSLTTKLELALALAEDYERYPLDIVLDAGLSTIFTVGQLSGFVNGSYDDTKAVSGILNDDAAGDVGLLDVAEGFSSLAQRSWQTIFNMFDGFCRETRKDCMFVADCIRQQLIQGKNQKILSDKSKNFSQHIYTPFKNLVANANSSYSAIYSQWSQIFDSNSGEFVWVPYSGFQAAIMARLDANRYPWFAPAGLENGLVRGVTDIALITTQKQRDLLYRHNINAVAYFPNDGIVCWGQKTLQKKPSAFDRINVRRLFLVLEKATRSTMKYFVFQPNTVFTRSRVLNVLTPVFDVPKNNEGVYDYLIVCDKRNNTPEVIDNNELKVAIYLKPVKSAEFVLVDFYATRQNQNFSELI